MPEDNAPASQEDNGAQGQVPTDSSQADTPEQSQADNFDSLSPEVQKAIRDLRREAASNRKRASDAESRVKEFEDKQLSQEEKAQKRVAELEAELGRERNAAKRLRVSQLVERTAARMGFVDPEDAVMLTARDLEEQDDLKDKDVESALKVLAERKPHLVRGQYAGSADGGVRVTTNSGDGSRDMNTAIRRAAGRA